MNLNSYEEKAMAYFTCIMVCHSVDPATDNTGKRILESASPDEISFIEYCEKLGFRLIDKTDKKVIFTDPLTNRYEFDIIEVFNFTSARKRMGLITRFKGKIVYFLKGADSIMVPFLKQEQ